MTRRNQPFIRPRTTSQFSTMSPELFTFDSAISFLTIKSKPEDLTGLEALRQAVDHLSREAERDAKRRSLRIESNNSFKSVKPSINLKRSSSFQIRRKPVEPLLQDSFQWKAISEEVGEVSRVEEKAETVKEGESSIIYSKDPRTLRRKAAPRFLEQEEVADISGESSPSTSSSSTYSSPSTPELRSRSSSSSISSLEDETSIDIDNSISSLEEVTDKPTRPLRNQSRLQPLVSDLEAKEIGLNLLQIPISDTHRKKKRQGILFYSQYTLNASTSSICSAHSEFDTEVFLDALSHL